MIFALHGFLGLPADWKFLKAKLHAVDVLAIHPPKEGLWRWAKAFNAYARNCSPTPRILLGYSMGARLAMHALLDAPALWQKAVFVSGQPGLSIEEKAKRVYEDKRWADRFLKDPWKDLMREWNRQPIFLQDKSFVRKEEDYSRPILAETILGFSQALQEDLTGRLEACRVPQHWIAGESDVKYAAIAREKPSHSIVPKAGHRVPWDNPDTFTQIFEELAYAPAGSDLARD